MRVAVEQPPGQLSSVARRKVVRSRQTVPQHVQTHPEMSSREVQENLKKIAFGRRRGGLGGRKNRVGPLGGLLLSIRYSMSPDTDLGTRSFDSG